MKKVLISSKNIEFRTTEEANKFCEAINELKNENVRYFQTGNAVRIETFTEVTNEEFELYRNFKPDLD